MACKCKRIGNTGTLLEQTLENPKKVIFTDFYKKDGTINEFDTNTTINQAFFTARTDNTDTNLRWLPLDNAYEIKIEPADAKIQTLSDNSTNYLLDGILAVTIMINAASPKLKGIVDKLRCKNLAMYLIDQCDSLAGAELTKEFLAPMRIDQNSLQTKWMPTNNDGGRMLEIKFNMHRDFKVETIAIIASDEMEDVNVSLIKGLIDVDVENVVITATSITFDLVTNWGTVKTPIMDEGRVTADFVSYVTAATGRIRNDDTSADVVVVATPNPSTGTITLTFIAQTAGDILRVKVVKSGKDYTAILEREFVAV